MKKDYAVIDDGHGNSWMLTCPDCGNDSMYIASVGRALCAICDDGVPGRTSENGRLINWFEARTRTQLFWMGFVAFPVLMLILHLVGAVRIAIGVK